MEKKRQFGELELTILNLFKTEQLLTVKEVVSMLGDEDKYTTVMTVMNRLVTKGQLSRKRAGKQYEYSLTKKSPTLIDKLKDKLFGGRSALMVNYLLESSDDISEEELDELDKLIQEMKKKS